MRLHDWPIRLTDVLVRAQSRAYSFGEHDCGLAAADAAEALIGVDPAAAMRGRYRSYRGGLKVLRQETGARSLQAWADQLWQSVPPVMAQRGDWALVKVPVEGLKSLRPALMVVDGPVLIGAEGVRLPRTSALFAWRIE